MFAGAAYVLWMAGILFSALWSGSWVPDTFVLFACLIPLAMFPIAFIALRPRPMLRKMLERFAHSAAVLFAWTAFADAILTPAGQQANLSGHEKAFLSVAVVLLPTMKRFPIFKLAAVGGLVVAFIKYPSATSTLVVLVALLSIWLLNANNRWVVVLLVLVIAAAIWAGAAYFSEWLDIFYQTMSRGDNTDTRLALWDQALYQINESPWTGTTASEPITGYANIRGEIIAVPFHNSLLSLAFCAGYIGLALFVFYVLAALAAVLLSNRTERKASLVWFPAAVAGLATMVANPVLEKLGTALPFYALLMCALIPAHRGRTDTFDGRRKYGE
ncbi:O-antigen ligase family protein [Sinomonas flava]|uniref:O-antigen ligase family protein n=1 Tax=Sinomonas flava TaxID=496857 RepID=UPI0039A511D0